MMKRACLVAVLAFSVGGGGCHDLTESTEVFFSGSRLAELGVKDDLNTAASMEKRTELAMRLGVSPDAIESVSVMKNPGGEAEGLVVKMEPIKDDAIDKGKEEVQKGIPGGPLGIGLGVFSTLLFVANRIVQLRALKKKGQVLNG